MERERFEAIQTAFRSQETLEGEKDALVGSARNLFDTIVKDDRDWPDKAQMQNLRTLAAGTTSIEEVKIYIQYQMGRGNRPPISRVFGNAVLKTMPREDIEKIRLFMGYLYRYYTYRKG